jgi:hypothetical protein
LATVGFIIDYLGRVVTFILFLEAPVQLFADWPTGLATIGVAAAIWVGSRAGRYLFARHAVDPTLQMPLSWW